MFLFVAGLCVLTVEAVRAVYPIALSDAVAFPLWARVLGPMLPLLGIRGTSGRIRIGMGGLSALSALVLNRQLVEGRGVATALIVGCALLLVWAGWTGTPSSARGREIKELVPWIAAAAVLLLTLRGVAWLLS